MSESSRRTFSSVGTSRSPRKTQARIVGSLGDITFKVSSKAMRTIQKLEKNVSVSYSEHKTHLKYPIMEFTGKDLATASFPITLSAFVGVNPTKYLKKLEKMMMNQKAVYFALGTKLIGKKWVITGIKESYQYFDRDGDVLSIDATVSIKEYR